VEPDVPFAQQRLAEVIDPATVEGRGAAHHPVNLIILVEQELGEVRTVLAGDAGDECAFHDESLLANLPEFHNHKLPPEVHIASENCSCRGNAHVNA